MVVGKAIFFGALAIASYGIFSYLTASEEVFDFPETGYYGKGQPKPDLTVIKPFTINVSQSVLDDLKMRLRNARIGHEQLEDVPDFQYGMNKETLVGLKDYWLNKYDWRRAEAELNAFPQFTTQIEGLQIHFIRVKPQKKYTKVVPLLIVHGWPGNVYEFHKILPMLTDPKRFGIETDTAFEVIAPSIPGYGWSEQPHKSGFSVVSAGRIFNKLMTERLGFRKYIAQGGDWGSVITSSIARLYPENLYGLHLNLIMASFNLPKTFFRAAIGSFCPSCVFSEKEYANYNLKSILMFLIRESGYMHIQSTKPDTVGVGLNDSPIGLLAYIGEKFSTWTNPSFVYLKDGGLSKKFTKDQLLTIVTVYWVNQNIVSSQRFYKENFADYKIQSFLRSYVHAPVGYAALPHELAPAPKEIASAVYNITHLTLFEDGGHFAAFEYPKELATDIFKFSKVLNV